MAGMLADYLMGKCDYIIWVTNTARHTCHKCNKAVQRYFIVGGSTLVQRCHLHEPYMLSRTEVTFEEAVAYDVMIS
jgi:hypothetical protein